jgi:uncharacterized protein (DUF2236 family)
MMSWSASPTVSTADLERRLASVAAAVHDPVAGLFGPESAVWEVNRHAAMFLGAGRAALLQVAHPAVAQAIARHSRTRTDPYGRFQRTFRQVFPMVWGSLDEALAAARAVHRVHLSIRGRFEEDVGRFVAGDAYDANDRAALLWVHATLWETSIAMHEAFVGPLDRSTKDLYYQETKRFAALFGLEDEELPPDWGAFLEYNAAMWRSSELAVGVAGREIARYLFEPDEPVAGAALDRLRVLTAALLPAPVRERFGLAYGESERRSLERWRRLLRATLPRLPPRLRYVPPYFDAQRRIAGTRGRDWVGSAVRRLYLGG